MVKMKVGSLSDFADDTVKTVSAGDTTVLIANIGDGIYAVECKCPHQGFPLEGSRREGFILICRAHGAQFDVRTGKWVKGYPTRDLRTFPVSIEHEEIFVDV